MYYCINTIIPATRTVLWLVENRQLLGELEGIDLLLQQLSVSEVITTFNQSFIRHCQHYYWQWKHLP